MLIGYVGSSDSNVTTTESQSSRPNSTTATAGSMANYYGTLTSMQSPAKLMALLNPTGDQQAPPSPNDPPGTILPGDRGDLSIEVNTLNGRQAVGINDLLNGNFQIPGAFGQSPQQLGQNLVWQYLKGTARSDGWQVNNDYAGNSSPQRLDAVLRACDPQTAYKLLSGQMPDPANSVGALPGSPVNQQDLKDQQLLQSDFKQLVANGTFTAGDIREIVDAQSRQSYGSEGLTTANIDNLIKGLGNDPNSQAVRQAFADESIKDAKTAINGQTSSQLWAQASDAVAGLGKTSALAYLQSLSPSDRGQLIGGALDGQAQQLEQPLPPNAPNSPMGSAAKLLEWAGQSAKAAPAGAAGNAQRNLAADLWQGAVDKFGGPFSSNAQALLQADGKNGIGLRAAMADCYSGAFPALLSRWLNESPNHLTIGPEGLSQLQNFAQAELAYPPLGSAKDVADRIAAPMQKLMSDISAYPTDPSKLTNDFGSTFGNNSPNEVASYVAGQIFESMRQGAVQDTQQALASNANAKGQADFALQVIGQVVSSIPEVGPYAGTIDGLVQDFVDASYDSQAQAQGGFGNAVTNAIDQIIQQLNSTLPAGPSGNPYAYIDKFDAGAGIVDATAGG
jgi:hypothetical protein